jgi:hypothetical protein
MPTNVAITQDTANPYSEADIRYNYNNLKQIIAASNSNDNLTNMAVYYSGDGGGTWTQTSIAPVGSDNLQGDPCVDWTSDGTAWEVSNGAVITSSSTTIVVRSFTSPDAGKTWKFDSIISGSQTFTDKPALWVDHSPSSPHKDNLYVIWHNGAQAWVSSRAGLAGSWSTPFQVSGSETTGTADGGDIKTNTFGDVFAFWPSSGTQTLQLVKSTDGGSTWTALGASPVQFATTFGSFTIKIPAQAARAVSGGTIGCLIYVSGGAYRTATQDNVYACWMDLTGETNCTGPSNAPGTTITSTCKTRIWFASSANGGVNWTSPVMLHNPSTLNDQFFPRMAVDETSGDLMVVYYDTVNDLTNRVNAELWMTSSTDGGATWSTPVQIATAATDEAVGAEDQSQEFGDYIGLTGYAGQFFACWTDRRSGGAEQIWGAPIPLVQRAVTLITERDHYGQDEIDAARTQPGGPVVKTGLRLQIDGYTARELGITGASSTGVAPTIAFSPSTGVSASCSSVQSSDNTFPPDELQTFFYNYDVNFGATDIAFTSFTGLTEPVTVSTSYLGFTPSGVVTFMKQPDPYILQGSQDWWLSSDVRLIQVAETDTVFDQTLAVGANPYTYLQSLITALEGGASGFDQNTTEANEIVTVAPLAVRGGQMVNVYNFAIARVHYQALSTPANTVRVFFRLFAANSTATNFEPTTTFRRFPVNYPVPTAQYGEQCIPTNGVDASGYVSIPCFAQARKSATQAGAANSLPGLQQDSNNVRNLPATGGPIENFFYGALLDINQTAPVLPQTPPSGNEDGPWPSQPSSNPMQTLSQAFIRNEHTCVVAEIAFDPDPVTTGVPPYNTDKLAQRNISWSYVANPGHPASRRALETFEVRPTPPGLAPGETPDELLIDWTNVPIGQTAEIYLPGVDADWVLRAAGQLYPNNRLSRVDAHTIGCLTDGLTLIPLPPGAGDGANFAGLMTIQLPYGIRKGHSYTVVVRQLTNATASTPPPPPPPPPIALPELELAAVGEGELRRWREVLGIFQITIPVSTREQMVENEEIRLSIFRWIFQGIPVSNRWYPVMERYLAELAEKVRALGSDPDKILPSQNGYDGIPPYGEPHPRPGRRDDRDLEEFTGKIDAVAYDHFGDFEGFVLELFSGEQRRFESREWAVQTLALRAWEERILVTVVVNRHRAHIPLTLMLRRTTDL